MKRDWEVVRYILSEVEKKEELEKPLFFESSISKDVLIYHIDLLIEDDLIKGNITKQVGGLGHPIVNILRLTGKGHKFIDAVRDEKVWGMTMKKIRESGVSTTFDVVKSVAIEVAKNILNV